VLGFKILAGNEFCCVLVPARQLFRSGRLRVALAVGRLALKIAATLGPGGSAMLLIVLASYIWANLRVVSYAQSKAFYCQQAVIPLAILIGLAMLQIESPLGIQGVRSRTAGTAVFGQSTSASGSGLGGYFVSNGATGRGVVGEARLVHGVSVQAPDHQPHPCANAVDGIWFGRTEQLPSRVKLAFRLDADEWQGQRRVRFLVEAAENRTAQRT
jgi:hypothetical protein